MASELPILAVVLDLTTGAVSISLLAYTAYWAFTIRRSLAIGLYRRQAVWTGAIAATYSILLLITFVFTVLIPPSLGYDVLVTFLQDVGILLVFAWIDTSVRIARRSDPLLRDSLHWSKLRFVLWTVVLGSFVLPWYYTLSNGIFESSGTLPVPVLVSLALALFTPFASGAVALPVSALRSGDRILRRHMVWFGFYVIVVGSTVLLALGTIASGTAVGFLEVVRVIIVNPIAEVILVVVLFAAAYSLYRSARSLVPLNKLSLDE